MSVLLCPKSLIFVKFWKCAKILLNQQTFFYGKKRRCSQIEPQLKAEIGLKIKSLDFRLLKLYSDWGDQIEKIRHFLYACLMRYKFAFILVSEILTEDIKCVLTKFSTHWWIFVGRVNLLHNMLQSIKWILILIYDSSDFIKTFEGKTSKLLNISWV